MNKKSTSGTKDFQFYCKSDLGKIRRKNDDYVGYYVPTDKAIYSLLGSLFVVADGVGGNSNGNVASRIAVNNIIKVYYGIKNTTISVQERLDTAIRETNKKILEESLRFDSPSMATTVVVAILLKNNVIFANVGDSRAYIAGPNREKGIEQITVDHTVIEEQLEKGLITQKEAKMAKNKNVITNALGNTKALKIDFFKVQIIDGDKILLTTDGLTHVVNDRKIQQLLTKPDIEANVNDLIIAANNNGGPDNTTICLIRPMFKKPKRKLNYQNLFVLSLILLILSLFWFIWDIKPQESTLQDNTSKIYWELNANNMRTQKGFTNASKIQSFSFPNYKKIEKAGFIIDLTNSDNATQQHEENNIYRLTLLGENNSDTLQIEFENTYSLPESVHYYACVCKILFEDDDNKQPSYSYITKYDSLENQSWNELEIPFNEIRSYDDYKKTVYRFKGSSLDIPLNIFEKGFTYKIRIDVWQTNEVAYINNSYITIKVEDKSEA